MIKNGQAQSGAESLLRAAVRWTACAWLAVLLGVSAAHAQIRWVDKGGHDSTADIFSAEDIFGHTSLNYDRPYTGITWFRDYGGCQLIVGLTSQTISTANGFTNRPDQLFELRGFYNNGRIQSTGAGRYVWANGKTAIRIKFKNGTLPNFLNAATNVSQYEAFVATIRLTIGVARGQSASCNSAIGTTPEYKITIVPLYTGGEDNPSQNRIASNTTDPQRGYRGWNGHETGIVIQRNLFHAYTIRGSTNPITGEVDRRSNLRWCGDGTVVSWIQRPSFLSFRKDRGTYRRISPTRSERTWQLGTVSTGPVTMIVQSYFLPTDRLQVVFNRKPDNGKHEFAVAVRGRCGNSQHQAILRYTLDIYANHPWGRGPNNAHQVPAFDASALSGSLGSNHVDTGLRIHYSAGTCDTTEVAVHSDSEDDFILRKWRLPIQYDGSNPRFPYRAGNWAWDGNSSQTIRANMAVGVQNRFTNQVPLYQEIVGVLFQSDFDASPGVYRPKFVLSSCSASTVPTTLTYTVTVAAANQRRGSWVTGSWKFTAPNNPQITLTSVADTNGGSAQFQASALTTYGQIRRVGFLIHRSSSKCLFTDLELKNHTSLFEINQVKTATAVTSSGRSTRTAMVMNDNQHAGVYFRPDVTYVAPDTYRLTVVATQSENLCPGASVAELPPPLTLRFNVVVSNIRPWETIGLNRGPRLSSFPAGAIAQLTTPADTGIRIQRSSEACRSTDLSLPTGTAQYFQLVRAGSNGRQVGNAGSSLAAVPMSVTGGSHAQVQFKPRANVPVGEFLISVVLSYNQSACGSQDGLPAALSLVYTITMANVADVTPMIAIDRDLVRVSEGVVAQAAATIAVLTVTDPFDATSPAVRLDTGATLFEIAAVRSWNGTDRIDAVRFKSGTRLSFTTKPQHTISFFAADGGSSNLSAEQKITIIVEDPQEANPSVSIDRPFAIVDEDQNTTPIATVTFLDERDVLPGIAIVGEGADQFELDYDPSDWSSSDGLVAALKIKSDQTLSRSTKDRYTLAVEVVDAGNQDLRATAAIEISVKQPGPPELTLPSTAAVNPTANRFVTNAIVRDNVPPEMALSGDDSSNFTLDLSMRPSIWQGSWTVGIYLKDGIAVDSDTKPTYTVMVEATDMVLSPAQTTTAPLVILLASQTQPPVSVAATVGTEVGSQGVRLAGMHGIDSILSRPAASGPGALAFLEMLANKEHELESGEIDLREFLDGQSFAMPLMNANGVASRFGMWMQAEQTKLEKESTTDLSYEANAFNANLGFDVLLGDFFTLGVGYGVHQLDTDYNYPSRCQGLDSACEGQKGTYELDLQIAQPYMAMDIGGGRLALAMGLGQGEIKVMDSAAASDEEFKRDADYTSYAVGINHKLGTVNQFRMRAVMSNSEVDIEEQCIKDGDKCRQEDGNDVLEPEMDFSGGNLRVGLGYARQIDFDSSRFLQPSIEVAYSSDWGDGDTGSLYGGGAGLEYRGGRMQVDSTFRYMTGEDTKVYGAALGLRFNPSAGSLGLGLEANPSYDLRGSGYNLLNENTELNENALPEHGLGLRSRMAVSYGFAINGGVLTPYGGYEMLTSSDSRRELGLRLATNGQRRWLLGWSADAAGDETLKIEYQLGE